MLEFYIGKVESVYDSYYGDRIKASIEKDKGKSLQKIPYAFPLLPKMLHVKPKISEAVIVIVANDEAENAQRWYIGPIISQPNKMYDDSFDTRTALSLIKGAMARPSTSVENYSGFTGALPTSEEIAIVGRKSTEVILGDDDVRIRAGVRNTDFAKKDVTFNSNGPAYIKLKHYETPLRNDNLPTNTENTRSTATIVADKINLISQQSNDGLKINDSGEGITDEHMNEIFEKAHRLPYGDLLCEFFSYFLKMYKAHSHPSNGAPPIAGDPESTVFWAKYSDNEKSLEDKLLSKNIRIS